ncbi:DUF726 domain-containing protein [Candidatus Sulfurimonas marisnigri]|uniref:DUF726 domain-containing protein n=1 Tax=Candidatus Sulfurimonas marisnigri TaxID=2740405 RepID=A0A7S7RRB9_9BACT|nr:DUF726 domain-containing protein [Candidatus Sulfurimonas marisnigri]QOY55601.1 DUF726 domain-containing protein [Candidatus Sulfurimonas marisnigri]
MFNDNTLATNNTEFSGLDKVVGDDKIFHVPGTFSDKRDVEKSFEDGLKNFYKDDKLVVVDLGRVLENSYDDRDKLAEIVVKQIIQTIKDNPDEPIRITGHSHGGNVQKLVTQKLVEQGYKNVVDDVMYLGTPVTDKHVMNNKALKDTATVINAYDKSDFVQKNGGDGTTSFFGINKFEVGSAGQTIENNYRVTNIEVESPNQGLETNSIFSLNPIITIGKIINKQYQDKLEDHSNIDKVEVLQQIKEKMKNDK